jgi:HAE1 family hydrophobic/amphiphilic exporter-1
MEGLEGQLFKDLAITMSVSHAASLLVAMTLIPAANRWALARGIPADQHQHWWKAMTDFAMRLTDRAQMRWLWIGALTCASVLFVLLFAPKVDYLPVAQTDMIWNNFRLPPGGNIETARTEFAPVVIERLRPYLEGTKEPRIKYYNFSAWDGFGGTAVVYPPIPATSRRPSRCFATRSWSGSRTRRSSCSAARCSVSTATTRARSASISRAPTSRR